MPLPLTVACDPGSLTNPNDAIERVLREPPFRDHARLQIVKRRPAAGRNVFAIAIPACNEEDRIEACLSHCVEAVARSGVPGRIVVLANNCVDGTISRAAAFAETSAVPVDIVGVALDAPLAHAGGARRLAFDLARAGLPASGVLMTTDADSRPDRDWARHNLAEIRKGAALVCGRIDFDTVERARLPPELTDGTAMEQAYRQAIRYLHHVLDPDPFNAWPNHGGASGASLAVTCGAYDTIGGAPLVTHAEDRALMALAREFDLPVVHAGAPSVVTSCRLDGRARGGMADTLIERLTETDYLCDDEAEPAETAIRRASLRRQLRKALTGKGGIDAVLATLKLDSTDLGTARTFAGFGKLMAFLEARSPDLARRRLRFNELKEQLPILLSFLDRLENRGDRRSLPMGDGILPVAARAPRSTRRSPPVSRLG